MDENLISQRIGKIESEQAAMSTSLRSLSNSIGDLSEQIQGLQDSSKTNWSTMASWSAVMLTIVGMVGFGFIARPMSSMELALVEMGKTQKSHLLSDGHGVALINSIHLSDEISVLSKTIRHESSLISSRIDSETDILERQMLENRSGVSEIRERLSREEGRLDGHIKLFDDSAIDFKKVHISAANIEKIYAMLDAYSDRIDDVEYHIVSEGHPHVQTESLKSLEKRVDGIHNLVIEIISQQEKRIVGE